MLVNIGDVIIREDRIRKDFGDISELAEDILVNGLINPPVVTPEKVLLAGERRMMAMKQLGYKQVEVRTLTVRDYEHRLMIEISENENRKNFSFTERMDLARRLEVVEREKARERQATSTGGAIPQLTQILAEGETNTKVAAAVGFGSKETLRKAKKVMESADPEMIKALDENQLSINGAYKKLQESLAEKEEQLSSKNITIENLMKKKDDKDSTKALENKQEELRKLKADLTKAETELKGLREVKEKKDELESLHKEVEKLKERQSKAVQEYKEMGKIFSWIDKTKGFIGNEMLQIPTLMYLPESPSKVVKDEVKHILQVISDWSYAMRQKFQIEEDEL
ncbi:MAG: ParB N-terminal domain-containing protein [Ignavibacteriaceae bacterium]|jgi:ParB family chromosome partitioning protein|nr:ParB N-terminal domain-containing protein [Ignavibacteriaceae bacterium]